MSRPNTHMKTSDTLDLIMGVVVLALFALVVVGVMVF